MATLPGYVAPPEVQCQGKRTFASKKGAKLAARQTPGRNWRGGGRLETYRCPHCGGWHNGHRPRRVS